MLKKIIQFKQFVYSKQGFPLLDTGAGSCNEIVACGVEHLSPGGIIHSTTHKRSPAMFLEYREDYYGK